MTISPPLNQKLNEFLEKIKARFSTQIYRRGLDYYYQDRVFEIQYNPYERTWYAEVEGSDYYQVSVCSTNNGITHQCDCPAHDSYGSCKHVVATLLEIHNILLKDPDPRLHQFLSTSPIGGHSNPTTRLIQLFANEESPARRPEDVLTQLKVDYILKLEKAAWGRQTLLKLELKVGVDRTYVVKNIHEFLAKVKNEKPLTFTKNFTYDPLEHRLSEQDQHIFTLLQEINESELFINQALIGGGELANRGLTVPPAYVERLLTLLQDRSAELQTDRSKYPNFLLQKLTSQNSPVSFDLTKVGEAYSLNAEGIKDVTALLNYNLLLVENIFYRLSRQQKKTYENLNAIFYYSDVTQLSIALEDLEKFFAHMVPNLKKFGHFEIEGGVSEDIVTHPLVTKMWIDQKDENLVVKLGYHYGDYHFSPFDEASNRLPAHKIMVRDIEKEKAILPYLNEASFIQEGSDLILEGDDAIFHFLYELLPHIEKEAEIYLSTSVRDMLLDAPAPPKINVDFESDTNWLDVSFDFKDIADEDVHHLLKSIVERKHFVRLPSGAFVPLQETSFQHVAKLFEDLELNVTDYKDGHLSLPAFRGLQVDEVLHDGKHRKYNKAFKALIQAIKEPEDQDHPLPEGLVATLRDYQLTGFNWLKSLSYYQFGGILADDMGLGKTLQTICFLLSEKGIQTEPALVVSPASLIYNWKKECEKFAPSLKVLVVSGTKQERQALLDQLSEFDVVITSYPLLRQDVESYKAYRFTSLILDEAQAIKNQATQTAKAVKMLNAAHRFGLSGTPIENSLDELWSIFEAVMPGFFSSKKRYSQLQQDKIASLTRPFILRRLKRDVLTELPDKIESVHTSELTKEQKKLYLGYLEKIKGETASSLDSEGFQKSRMKILAGLTRLRQLCCHPSLFIENYDGESGKLNQLLELVEQALENGQRLLIFSQFSSMLKLIQGTLKKLGHDTFYIDGETPSKDRVELSERFNQGERDLFLISLKAGGTGLNLTGADTVILYDLWWNPAIEEQAAGRAHRIGQKKVVQVIRLITEGTIEEKIYELQQKKKELIDAVIQPGETQLSSLSESDIRELLNL